MADLQVGLSEDRVLDGARSAGRSRGGVKAVERCMAAVLRTVDGE